MASCVTFTITPTPVDPLAAAALAAVAALKEIAGDPNRYSSDVRVAAAEAILRHHRALEGLS